MLAIIDHCCHNAGNFVPSTDHVLGKLAITNHFTDPPDNFPPISLWSVSPFQFVVVIVCYQPEVEVECDVEEYQAEQAEPENISLQKGMVYS